MKVVCSSNEYVNSGDVVLVRNELDEIWAISIFSHTDNDNYICTNNTIWKYCVPLADNEYLCGTSKNYYIMI